MPKGQRRSNREIKKPKQVKRSVVPAALPLGMQLKTAPVPGRKT
jgi:hypothetical protein